MGNVTRNESFQGASTKLTGLEATFDPAKKDQGLMVDARLNTSQTSTL